MRRRNPASRPLRVGRALVPSSSWLPAPGSVCFPQLRWHHGHWWRQKLSLWLCLSKSPTRLSVLASWQFHFHRSIPKINKDKNMRRRELRKCAPLIFFIIILGDLYEARWQLPTFCDFRPLPDSKNNWLIHSPACTSGKSRAAHPSGWL